MKALTKLFLSQKGAMFGMDGRISLVIFASLSVIAGASIIFNRIDAQATVLHGELKALHEAIKVMQSDFENDLYASLDSLAARHQNAVDVLFDDTELSAVYQNDWHGPYIDEFIQPGARLYRSQNNVVGVTFTNIMKHANGTGVNNAVVCSNAAPCYYWVRISNLPERLLEILNEKIDGTAETTPEDEGRLQWNDSGTAGVVNLWYLTERALDNNNGSVGL